jgi:hypothetical protein
MSGRNGKGDSKSGPVKLTVTLRAITQRLRRVLPKEHKLMRTRPIIQGERRIYPRDVGRFYIINVADKTIVEHHIDIEAFGRRYQVLQPWEVLERERLAKSI